MKKQLVVGSLLALCSTLAAAHSGHALASVEAGFLHPFTGWDHLLMLLAVGAWSAQSSGNKSLDLPLTFILVLAFGASLGFFGLSISGLETAIALSVMAMGLLMAVKLPNSTAVRMGVVAVFALFHGLAHGVELSAQHYAAVMAGMLLAAALLSGLGFWVGSYRNQISFWFNKVLALLMLGFGGLLLMH